MLETIFQKLYSFAYAYFFETLAVAFQWNFLLANLLIMLIIYWFHRRNQNKKRIGIKDAFSFLFPKHIFLDKSAILEYKFFFVDAPIRWLLFSPAMQIPISAFVFVQVQNFLVYSFNEPTYKLSFHETSPYIFSFLFAFTTVIITELGFYIQHNLMHRISFLWEFHKVHHSATALTPFTDWRNHPFDMLSMHYLTGIMLGTLQAILSYSLTSNLTAMSIIGFNIFIFAYYSVGYNFRHSHIKVSFGRHLSHIFMSPTLHHIHHSTDFEHLDKNFGSNFSFWDWVFGTLYIPKENKPLNYGLLDDEHKEYNSLWTLYILPFKKNLAANRHIQIVLLASILIFFAISSWVAIIT